MPEIYFQVQWPDGEVTDCYSPSTVVRQYFHSGEVLSLAEFVARSREALGQASERVRAKYGFGCGQATQQLAEIVQAARRFQPEAEARVTILSVG